MEITLQQIHLIMQRANVSYSEAKAALEQANGDILEALLLLEQSHESVNKASQIDFTLIKTKFITFINKLNTTSFIMQKKEHIYIDVPLSVALIFIVLCFPVSISTIIISFILGIRIHIQSDNNLIKK